MTLTYPRYLCILASLCFYTSLTGQSTSTVLSTPNDISWADSVLTNMSLEAKLGQLFILKTNAKNSNRLDSLIKSIQPGGVLIKDASLYKYVRANNTIQKNSKLPILNLSDQSVSIKNQLSDFDNMPSPAGMSSIDDELLKSSLFRTLLQDQSTLNINCSLAPNITIHQNTQNTYSNLANEQEFSTVFNRTNDQIAQLEKQEVLSILRGFSLPNPNKPATKRKEYSFAYKTFINTGLSGVFIEASNFETDNKSVKSPNFFKDHLQDKYNYNGLIIGAIGPEISLLDLIYAGAGTFIVNGKGIEAAVQQMKKLVLNGQIDIKRINQQVKQVLLAKTKLNLHQKETKILDYNKVQRSIRKISDENLTALFERSAIFGNDPKKVIPLDASYGKMRRVIHVGQEKLHTFQRTVFDYANCSYKLHQPNEANEIDSLDFNSKSSLFIIALDQINLSADKHTAFLQSIDTLYKYNEIVIVNFGNPFNLKLFDPSIPSIQLFDRNKITEKIAAQVLFGSTKINGSLPLALSKELPRGYKGKTSISRLLRANPKQVGIDPSALNRIDEIVQYGIDSRAMPGCQVLVAKEGKIIYSKSFGHHTYAKKQTVERSDLYDVASITKVAATTLAIMKLNEQGRISTTTSLGKQMTLPKYSTIRNIPLTNFLIHQSGLQRNMPISRYLYTKENNSECSGYFCDKKSPIYSQAIAKDMYMNPDTEQQIWKKVNQLDRPNKYKYRSFYYGDVNFYILQKLVEEETGIGLDDYVKKNFYDPLGLRYCLFNPLNRIPETMIPPTQENDRWRKSELRGYVHDETAALHGGVAGNAGLFSNAEDLAILFQMLLNGGTYGGKQYLTSETIDLFTSAGHGNHRGLGFDKPGKSFSIAPNASPSSYGHAGFSGTCVWVDPDEELVYIFLANRIYPDPKNNKLMRLGIRRKVHQAIYDAIQTRTQEEVLMVNLSGAE